MFCRVAIAIFMNLSQPTPSQPSPAGRLLIVTGTGGSCSWWSGMAQNAAGEPAGTFSACNENPRRPHTAQPGHLHRGIPLARLVELFAKADTETPTPRPLDQRGHVCKRSGIREPQPVPTLPPQTYAAALRRGGLRTCPADSLFPDHGTLRHPAAFPHPRHRLYRQGGRRVLRHFAQVRAGDKHFRARKGGLTYQNGGEASLVLCQNIYKGWQTTIDGNEVPLSAANFAMQCVNVPAGEHEIVFEYRRPEITALFWLQCAVTALCLAMLCGMVVRRSRKLIL